MEKSTSRVQKLFSAKRKNSLRVIHRRKSSLSKRQKSIAKILSQNSINTNKTNWSSIPFADLFCFCGKTLRKEGKSDKLLIKESSDSSNTVSDNVSLFNLEEKSSGFEEDSLKEDSPSTEDELLRLEQTIDLDKLNLGGNLKYFLTGAKLSSIVGCSKLPKTFSDVQLLLDSNPLLKAQLKNILGDNLKNENMKPVADLFASNKEMIEDESDLTIGDVNIDVGSIVSYSTDSESSMDFKKFKVAHNLAKEKLSNSPGEETKDCNKKKSSFEIKNNEHSSSLISKLFGSLFQSNKSDQMKKKLAHPSSSKTSQKELKCPEKTDLNLNEIRQKYDEWFQKSKEEEREKFKWEDFEKVNSYFDNSGETEESDPNKAVMLRMWLKKFSQEIGVTLSHIDNGSTTLSDDLDLENKDVMEMKFKRIDSDEMLNVAAGDVVARLNILMRQLNGDFVQEVVGSQASSLNENVEASNLNENVDEASNVNENVEASNLNEKADKASNLNEKADKASNLNEKTDKASNLNENTDKAFNLNENVEASRLNVNVDEASNLNDGNSLYPATISTNVAHSDDESSKSNDEESMCQVICASFVHKLSKYTDKDIKSTVEQMPSLNEPQESNNYQVFCVPEVITRSPLNCWGRSHSMFEESPSKRYRSESYFLNESPTEQELYDHMNETFPNSCLMRDTHYDRFKKLSNFSHLRSYSKHKAKLLDEVNSQCQNDDTKRQTFSQKKVAFNNSTLYIESNKNKETKIGKKNEQLSQTSLLSPKGENNEIEAKSTNTTGKNNEGTYFNTELFSNIYQSQKLYELLSQTSLYSNDKSRETEDSFNNCDDENEQEKYFDTKKFNETSHLEECDKQPSHTSILSSVYENKEEIQTDYENSNKKNGNVTSYMKYSPNCSCLNINTYQTSIQSLEETHDTRECWDFISEHSNELLSVLKYLVSLTHLNQPILEKVCISEESVQSKVTDSVGVQCNLPQEDDKVTVNSQTSSNPVQELSTPGITLLSDAKLKRVASLMETFVISEESNSMCHSKSDCYVVTNLSNRHRLSSLPDLLHGAQSFTSNELFINRSEQRGTDFDNSTQVEMAEVDEPADNHASNLMTSISCQVSQTPDVDCFSMVSSSDVIEGNNILLETTSNIELKTQPDEVPIKEKSRSEEVQSISNIGLPVKTNHKNRLKKIIWKIGIRDTKKKK